MERKVDIDPDDKGLLDEMLMLKYKFHSTGSIQIESKDEMRSRGVKSPDHLDAAVYAAVNLDHLFDDRMNGAKPGDKLILDPEIAFQDQQFYSNWVW